MAVLFINTTIVGRNLNFDQIHGHVTLLPSFFFIMHSWPHLQYKLYNNFLSLGILIHGYSVGRVRL